MPLLFNLHRLPAFAHTAVLLHVCDVLLPTLSLFILLMQTNGSDAIAGL
jgi:hypothetical protein